MLSSSPIMSLYAQVVLGISSDQNSSSGDNNNNTSRISSSGNNNTSSSSSSSSSSISGNNKNSSSSVNNNISSNSDNSNNDNRLGYCFSEQMSSCSLRGPADEPSNAHYRKPDTKPSPPQRFAGNNRGGAQRLLPPWIARSLSDSDHSMPSSPSLSPPPPTLPFARVYYTVNASNTTVNKLVEHYCTFCYKNQEPPEVYGSHLVRDAMRTTCPKLRALRCRHCNGTGDGAHTIKYCPFLYTNYK
uniref:Nanos protein n=1 Tax=Sipha flava TaxID=143950 RepID=A0A2S2Q2T7_9HEMI